MTSSPSPWTIALLSDRLTALGAAPSAEPTAAAAVAIVIRLEPIPSVLLMKRAARDGDPWSGHIACPGGRFQEGDGDLLHTAMRETREEVGVDLEKSARLVGALHTLPTLGRTKIQPTSVTPFVFVVEEPVEVVPNEEAESAFWMPLEAAAGGQLDGEFMYQNVDPPLAFQCWNYEGHVIWGLTYRMLRSLIEAAVG